MLPKGILFDLDDTILAYTPVADPTWKRICEEFAYKNDQLEADRLFGAIRKASSWYWSDKERHKTGRQDLNSARRQILFLAFQDLEIDNQALAGEIADTFSEQREEAVYLFEKAEETLEYLNTNNVSLALITNGEARKQGNKIKRFHLEKYFKTILIEGVLGYGKPEESVYIHALDGLGLCPEDVWSVGDNLEWDVAAPQKLGIFGIWNDFAGKGLPPTTRVIPNRIIHNISELRE